MAGDGPDVAENRPRVTDAQSAILRIALLGWQEAPQAAVLEAAALDFGAYDGLPAQVALLADGRQAKLLAPISYRQGNGTAWPVPVDSLLDGASIPRLFWTLIGGPFEGLYRDASIVHDRYCVTKERPWPDTHRMFYEAMRCSGVAEAKAKIMYYAVYRFGPRWPLGTAATALAVAVSPQAPGDADAASIAADAEAIYTHGLSLDEIDNLADARAQPGSTGALETMAAAAANGAPGPAALARARLLVVTGGRGTAEDLEAVAQEAAHLPDFVLARFENKTIRIVACRDGVTDFETSLRNVTPRGWEGTGRTWDNVPGTYFDNRKRVVIATIAGGTGRTVPTRASGLHGSAGLVVHESLHGYDYSGNHAVLRDQRFTGARQDDLARLGAYERQPGQAGLEETFAESGARFMVERDALNVDWPHLGGYWAAGPAGVGSAILSIEAAAAESAELGTAEKMDDGTIRLDLRAEGPGGAIGHAVLNIETHEAGYSALHDHLFGGGGAGFEAAALSRKVPFRPLKKVD